MGSFSSPAKDGVRPASPLSVIHKVTATCTVTNRIDIDKYFEVLKQECAKTEKPKNGKRTVRRSASSGKIDVGNINKRKASRNKYEENDKDITGKNYPRTLSRKSSTGLNYDLSGQVIDQNNNNNDHCLMSRQQSLDLNLSKVKTKNCCDNTKMDLTSSYSAGDFKDFVNNSRLVHSKSCECVSDLHLKHHEHAVVHGKIYSVSEQNRRHRRKYYQRRRFSGEEKVKGSQEKVRGIDPDTTHVIDEDEGLDATFQKKLSL